MEDKDDTYYISQVKEGNVMAFRMLVERHQKNVLTVVMKLVGDRLDAEEIAQDVFVKAFQAIGQFRGASKFSTWLYRIAYNHAISFCRKKKMETLPIHEEVLEENTEREFFNRTDDIRMKFLPEALKTLVREDQLLISLYYQQNCRIREIAEITEYSRSNIKIRLFRARKQLYEYIHKQTAHLKKELP